ncbi:hypothetical protein BJ742DRAFT_772417 [Cladochytrium replicatum]|nr:hypothetical protein BJ742DRAFT_772417 [Cladochytrium replicatum]
MVRFYAAAGYFSGTTVASHPARAPAAASACNTANQQVKVESGTTARKEPTAKPLSTPAALQALQAAIQAIYGAGLARPMAGKVKAAESARVSYNLPDVKTYGDPKSLAADPEIDLAVIGTGIETQFSLSSPYSTLVKLFSWSWPWRKARSQQHHGLFLRLKEFLKSGIIGKSFQQRGKVAWHPLRRDRIPEMALKTTKRETGVNMLDFVHEGFTTPTTSPFAATSKNTRNRTAPDALLSHVSSRPTPFKNAPGFIWRINGDRGEMRIKSHGPLIDSDSPYDHLVTIELNDHATGRSPVGLGRVAEIASSMSATRNGLKTVVPRLWINVVTGLDWTTGSHL